jgi:hypothetical protein
MSCKTRELKSPTDECFYFVDECATLFQILSVTEFKDPKLHRSTAFPFPSPNVGQVPRCVLAQIGDASSFKCSVGLDRVKWLESANMVH